MNKIIIRKALSELTNPMLESTKDVLSYVGIENEFKIEDIEGPYLCEKAGLVSVYFPILNGKVFIAVYLETGNLIRVLDVVVESGTEVYLVSRSKDLSLHEMANLSGIQPSSGRNKGDKVGNRTYDQSSLFLAISENKSEDIQIKLNRLLTFLEQETKIENLAKETDSQIKIVFWNYFRSVEGLALTASTISRLAKLKLALDIESYLVE